MESCKDRDPKCEFQCPSNHHLAICGSSGETDVRGRVPGLGWLYNKKYNKGLAFTLEERQRLGIHGLLPAVVKSVEEQINHCSILVDRLPTNLDKYIYLNDLAERNQRLLFQLVATDTKKFIPLLYTPTVGEVCMNFSLIYQQPRGLFIPIKDKGHIYDLLSHWPENDIRAIVVTDGERILGLGDLGANGMGIPIGKLMLYTALAGIKPQYCLPITLDCGTNRKCVLIDPLYVGLRINRVRGPIYDEFIDEFMKAVVRRYGQNCLIQFEDFGNKNAFRLIHKYRNSYCTFNDDIQGTGAVVLAGILSALKVTKKPLRAQTILFFGAGEASIGTARIFLYALIRSGATTEEAKKRIWLYDTKGLVIKGRNAGGLTVTKLEFAQRYDPIETLPEAVFALKPTILIGASAVYGAFTKQILELMAKTNERPIIFALSNPNSKSECTAQEAYNYTKGKCLFASGSPYPPVEYNPKIYTTGQSNNHLIFPGVALGVICSGMIRIPEEVFYLAAETLSELVTSDDLANGSLYPSHSKITCCSIEIAKWVMEYGYRYSLASIFPEPKDKYEFIKSQMYNLNYPPIKPELYLKEY